MLTVDLAHESLAIVAACRLAAMVVDSETAAKFQSVISKTFEMARRSPEKFAHVVGMDKAQLHRQLMCDGHLSVQRLFKDPEVLKAFAAAVLLILGVPEFVQEAEPTQKVKKAMAKMDLSQPSREEVAS